MRVPMFKYVSIIAPVVNTILVIAPAANGAPADTMCRLFISHVSLLTEVTLKNNLSFGSIIQYIFCSLSSFETTKLNQYV
jgi:hypothetical protein